MVLRRWLRVLCTDRSMGGVSETAKELKCIPIERSVWWSGVDARLYPYMCIYIRLFIISVLKKAEWRMRIYSQNPTA